MAYKAGTVAFLKLDSAAGALVDLSAYTDTHDFTTGRAMLDVTSFGTSAEVFISGVAQGQVFPIGGAYDAAVFGHFGSLLAAQDAGTASHSILWGPGGSVSGQAKVTAESLVSDFKLSLGVKGRVEWSATLQITGAVTLSTF